MTTLAELLRNRRTVLLDFDGPICAVFGSISDRVIARELVGMVGSSDVPDEIQQTNDPFEVLQYLADHTDADLFDKIERRLTELECSAVMQAPPTAHASNVIAVLSRHSYRIAVVTNNSTDAAQLYLRSHDLIQYIDGVFGRPGTRVDLLKPNPFLLTSTINALETTNTDCIFVGDSLSDVLAAQAADVATVAYANKPGKAERFAPLRPDALITSMDQIAGAIP